MKIRSWAGVALAAAVAGCATFSPDGGMDEVRTLAQQRIGAPAKALGASQERVDTLLRAPLSADGAVEKWWSSVAQHR